MKIYVLILFFFNCFIFSFAELNVNISGGSNKDIFGNVEVAIPIQDNKDNKYDIGAGATKRVQRDDVETLPVYGLIRRYIGDEGAYVITKAGYVSDTSAVDSAPRGTYYGGAGFGWKNSKYSSEVTYNIMGMENYKHDNIERIKLSVGINLDPIKYGKFNFQNIDWKELNKRVIER